MSPQASANPLHCGVGAARQDPQTNICMALLAVSSSKPAKARSCTPEDWRFASFAVPAGLFYWQGHATVGPRIISKGDAAQNMQVTRLPNE